MQQKHVLIKTGHQKINNNKIKDKIKAGINKILLFLFFWYFC